MHRATLALVVAVGLGCLAAPASAEFTLDDVSIGDHWYGEQVSVDTLRGRVWLFEMWGQN